MSHVSCLRANKGQALLELAIFGSLFILVLGVLLNYGLNADYSQRAKMEAFRQALALSSDSNITGGGSYALAKDRYIPNPSNPFALGSDIPVSESGSVIRDFRLDETADTVSELPRVNITVNGEPFDCPSAGTGCTTAGFRTEPLTGSLDRYQEVYGSSNVNGGGDTVTVIDSCEGEVVSFESCVRQARMIVDSDACTAECKRGKFEGSDDCASTCAAPMTVPWYAQGAVKDTSGKWTFPNLNTLFTGITTTGLQRGSSRHTTMASTLHKQETASAVSTTDSVNWRDDVTRKVVYKPLGDTSGTPVTQSVTTTPKDEQNSTTWTTPW
ncbi:MAG: hypothetical protein HY596_01190 [Candidatus Omnitrophica bacterium]|nr:hypothetical protein [Candidatus Omnitrophota bacterium]